MRIPSYSDWSPEALGEDALTAYHKFFGKSNEEMQAYFRGNVISAINDIRFMPEVPFQYYLLGLCQYVAGENLNKYEACAAASGFLGLVLQKVEDSFRVMEPLLQDLVPVIEHVVKTQHGYGADKDIYGDFGEISKKITDTINKKKNL